MVVAAMLAAPAPAASAADPYEPNDGIHQARYYYPNRDTSGEVGDPGDQDWFVLSTTGEGVLDVALTNDKDDSACRPTLTLRDTDGGGAGAVSAEERETAHVTYDVPGKTRWFIVVSGPCAGDRYSFKVGGPVRLGPVPPRLKVTPDANQDAGQAIGPLQATTLYAGRIDADGDQDWSFFYVPGAVQFGVAMTNVRDATGCRAQLALVDRAGATVASIAPEENRIEHITHTPPHPAKYFVAISGGCTGDEYIFQLTGPISYKPVRSGECVAARALVGPAKAQVKAVLTRVRRRMSAASRRAQRHLLHARRLALQRARADVERLCPS